MVASSAWKTIEPEISLEGFLASEELDFFPAAAAWMPEEWAADDEENASCETRDF